MKKVIRFFTTRKRIRKQINHYYALIAIERNQADKLKGADKFKGRFMIQRKVDDHQEKIDILKGLL